MSKIKSRAFKNVFFSFGGEAIIMVLGIIVPRIMITSYGSDTNGLLNTISQIFSYMALMEAGIGQAAKNALFKPISEHNKKGISYVTSVASNYFRRITLYYAIGVLTLSVLAPLFLKTNVDRQTVFLVVLLQGMSGVVSFYYLQTMTMVLAADGRNYVNSGLKIVNQALSYSAKIIMAANGVSIIILQFVYFLITVGKVLFYKLYFKKHYNWIDLKIAPKSAELQDRNSYIITELAWTIFSSTDMIVLSTFLSTKLSSVYTVYNLVFHSLNTILSTVYFSINYILGQSFHRNRNQYMQLHDDFTSVFFGGMTVLMCTAYTLTLPFIKLYTHGVADVDYYYSELPILFCLVQELSWSRYITGNLSGVAGYAKPVSRISLIEALINIVLSIMLVNHYGIIGVLFATVIALPIKVVYLTWLSEKVILKRKALHYLTILGVNFAIFGISVLIKPVLNLQISSYTAFIKYGSIVFLTYAAVSICINTAVNPHCLRIIRQLRKRNE